MGGVVVSNEPKQSKPPRKRAPKAPAAPKPPRVPSKLEAEFLFCWRGLHGPALESEVKFHPFRRWSADFVHRESMTMIEIEGGIWGGGRHTTGSGFAKDCEKYLEATLLGWRVIRLCNKQLDKVTVGRLIDFVTNGGKSPRLVVIESPYAGDVEANVRYARACLRDSLKRGEFPLASHLLYTQEGVLDDADKDERALGMLAGFTWGELATATIVYADLGISAGMAEGIARAEAAGRFVEVRRLGFW